MRRSAQNRGPAHMEGQVRLDLPGGCQGRLPNHRFGISVASHAHGKGEARELRRTVGDAMFQETIDKFTLVGEQKVRFLRDNPLGFWISSMMAGI
jgi:hypothetical protein